MNTRSACACVHRVRECSATNEEHETRQRVSKSTGLESWFKTCCVVVVLNYKLVCNKEGGTPPKYKLITN